MVNLTRIYTRTGDAGQTRLSDMSLTSKTDARVAAYGDVDEANSILGVVTALEALPQPILVTLRAIQNELFDVGADLSNPVVAEPKWEPLRVTAANVERLEAWCDEYSEGLPDLASFILPGGTPSAGYLHLARTVVRRAERAAWAAAQEYGFDVGAGEEPGGLNPLAITYLNRLSDLLFILARVANTGHDVLWIPGKDREPVGERAERHRARIRRSQAENA
ncbi:cob(I)yrinic acid a,c-diamide adenosyltransferase [Propioniciclava coleopterorum]|uniref:Corrinoid adenosyltransferase n=1 Tax=Propioniciclava coleopterorum TaxID=2714937 RepID=A0A6G7Y976_9ACTN|nr:cob(I)yrinic acid a,c-diamide adenosyltransferase [Propioniciclava coleopterorum]QIK73330.1 cob(I)yrinic acid a,c-diamide adenosyltransferase [Propioniciclava coleopterorum]